VLHKYKLLGLSRSRWPRAVPKCILVELALKPHQVLSASVLWMGESLPKTPGLSPVEVLTWACRQVRGLVGVTQGGRGEKTLLRLPG